ncbi:protein ANTAGONIST OF LIKE HETEROCHROMATIN PROTEIN 1-like [Pieris napi]|uniref:protein ANTAGONIST OF LIKE HETEROCHROMATIN PROTEIN 1-like n=1 Tax=Pieris napi TaxID=78633 RepID=UPI001FBB1D05|nr:protein ANTAGONIST OF LIKE HETEROCHROMATIN PROTEIN 1-like [Pieris napi]
MDAVEIACVIYYYSRKQRKKNKKRYWIHPLLETRNEFGQFASCFQELKKHQDKFFGYVRMSVSSFEELLTVLYVTIKGQDSKFRDCIQPEEKLVITLRYFATGCTFAELHYTFKIGVSTVAEIVREVCFAIWFCLKDICLPQPKKDAWKKIANDFFQRANFPNCLGAVDGKHIRCIAPNNSGSMCFNYKSFFSLVLLAVCDSNFKFVMVDIGAFGKFSDSSIFQNSVFYERMQKNQLDIPEPQPISQNSETCMPYVFVGDEAFALSTNMMRPYAKKDLDETKRTFNYRLSRARRYVECSFGIYANKWRIFHRPLNVHFDLAKDIIKATCVLHNFVRDRDGYCYDDSLSCPLTENLTQEGLRRNAKTAL